MNALITLVWHITKNDVRRLRWLIAAWGVLTLLQAVLRVIWPPMMLRVQLHPDLGAVIESVRTMLPLMRGLLFAELVVLLIHADSLVKTDAFWLTRPIAPRVLFLSKLLTTALTLIVPTCLTHVALMLAFGVPLLDIVSVTPEILLYTTFGMTVVLIGAALTANQRELMALTAGLCILVLAVLVLIGFVQGPPTMAPPPHPLPSMALWADVQIVTFVLLSIGFAGTAWHLYRTRRRGQSALIAAAAVGFSLCVSMLFPPDDLVWGPAVRTLAPAIPVGTAMHYEDGPRSLEMWRLDEFGGNCQFMLRTTRVRGLRVYYERPMLNYSFVHRPTGLPVSFNEDSHVQVSRDLAPLPLFSSSEDTEVFQIVYRRGWVFPPREPKAGDAPISNVPCRHLGVLVERHTFTPGD
jgi:hypothetical protein